MELLGHPTPLGFARRVERVAVERNKASLQSDGDVASPCGWYRQGVRDCQRKRSGGGLRIEASGVNERDRCRKFGGSVVRIEVPAGCRIVEQWTRRERLCALHRIPRIRVAD